MHRRFSVFSARGGCAWGAYFLLSLVVVGALSAILLGGRPVFAQENGAAKPPAVEQPLLAAPKPAQAGVPAPPVASAKFLAGFDKFVALGEARMDADKKRAEYEAAVKVLDEQREALRRELLAQIPAGYTWDAAKRALVKLPEAPAKEKEKP